MADHLLVVMVEVVVIVDLVQEMVEVPHLPLAVAMVAVLLLARLVTAVALPHLPLVAVNLLPAVLEKRVRI